MYGTVAKLKVKPGSMDALMDQLEQYDDLNVRGMYASYMLQCDDDPSTCYLTAIFEDEEAYRANAESPEQHQRYTAMMQHLQAEPEWHDGEFVGHVEAN